MKKVNASAIKPAAAPPVYAGAGFYAYRAIAVMKGAGPDPAYFHAQWRATGGNWQSVKDGKQLAEFPSRVRAEKAAEAAALAWIGKDKKWHGTGLASFQS